MEKHCFLSILLILFYTDWTVGAGQDVATMTSMMQSMQQQLTRLQATIDLHFSNSKECSGQRALPLDCQDIFTSGRNTSGIYTVYPPDLAELGVIVYCDMDDDDGGWLVIQRRRDGSTNFFTGWQDYENGFGNKSNEYWLGNKNIHAITSSGTYELRVVLTDFQSNTKTANYRTFKVNDKLTKYQLQIDGYSGDAGDSLQFDHNGHAFSTADNDNDGSKTVNCAQTHQGGYWYSNCFKSNINGKWGVKGEQGIVWGSYKNWDMYVLKETEMKIRPASAQNNP